ncbi:DUF1381 domain-containing protein [Staphylococcus epidermidis]|uniref:DUF1381 domain-containing protein n=1 Tax=Staphylococcus epidermidis TaxID=1282 RepID=UPI00320467C8
MNSKRGVEEVKQFLIREFTDSTVNVYVDVEQPRENECMTLVEAEDKEEAKEKAKRILSQHDRLQLRKLYRLQERLG